MQSSTKTTKVTSCALAAKTVRACESCLMRRARWYCASDNAFLCHACDNSIHVANKLASRHKRARLESASFKTQTTPSIANPSFHSAPSLSPSTLPPPWHGGFTRKARTPRHGPHSNKHKSNNSGNNNNKNNRVVPEIGSENEGDDDLCGSLKIDKENDQLMFSVPVFDPFEISSSDLDHQNEFCENSKVFGGGSGSGSDGLDLETEFDISLIGFDDGCDQLGQDNSNNDDDENKWNSINPGGFMPSDAELADFAADVETLLVDDVEEGRMKRMIPLLDDYKVENMYDHENYGMKVEDDQLGESVNMAAFSSCWGLDFSIKCDDKKAVAEEEENLRRWVEDGGCDGGGNGGGKESEIYSSKKIFLRLNYDAVISAWASRGSPWTSGCRPELDGLGGWPSCMGGVGTTGVQNPMGEMGRGGHVVGGDGGRGARVLRYREKRKSRLFSKKIRYQVRKLNAEKRPRLKGRFVKRTPSTNYSTSPLGVQPTFPYLKV